LDVRFGDSLRTGGRGSLAACRFALRWRSRVDLVVRGVLRDVLRLGLIRRGPLRRGIAIDGRFGVFVRASGVGLVGFHVIVRGVAEDLAELALDGSRNFVITRARAGGIIRRGVGHSGCRRFIACGIRAACRRWGGCQVFYRWHPSNLPPVSLGPCAYRPIGEGLTHQDYRQNGAVVNI
jgi:hypothetical protein